MYFFIYGFAFSDISFLESLWFGACSPNTVFSLAKNKSKAKLDEISFEDKVLSQGISFKSFLNSS